MHLSNVFRASYFLNELIGHMVCGSHLQANLKSCAKLDALQWRLTA